MSRAIVFNGDGTWEQRDIPKPRLRAGGAVLRVEATGLCHSDVDQFHGHNPAPSGGVYPTVPGHEIVGRIEDIDPAAATEWGVDVGERVGVRTIVLDGKGPSRVYGSDFPLDEGSGLFGGYADYMELVPGSAVHRLRDDLPAAEVTLFECMSNAVTWVHPVKEGDVVVVEGPGHMGLATIVSAKAVGASTVIVTGLTQDRFRLETALKVGADHAIDVATEDAVERVADITGGAMADVVLDTASGSPVTVAVALDLVRRGGTIVLAGFKDRKLDDFDVNLIVKKHVAMLPGGGLDLARRMYAHQRRNHPDGRARR